MSKDTKPLKEKKTHDIRSSILQLFKDSKNKKYSFKQIKKKLSKYYTSDVIYDALQELVIDKIIEQRGQAYTQIKSESPKGAVAKNLDLLEGTIELTQSGMGFVTVEGIEEDIRIHMRNTNRAMTGDKVKIVLLATRGKRQEGRVVEIVERGTEFITGLIEQSGTLTFLIPDAKNMQQDFFIPQNKLNGATHRDKVIAKFVEWDEKGKNPVAEVVKILGKAGLHETEMTAILVENGFRLEFPNEVEEECANMDLALTPGELALRRDFRGITTFTIDPADAKDFDDALSFRELKEGVYEIGVHIADVSHYVRKGTLTDIEAAMRGTSVYLVDRVVPMLPEKLSNYLCSLRPNEDKLTYSAVVQMDEKGKVLDQWFGKTIIHSNTRFSYEEAQEILEGKAHELSGELLKLNELAYKLRKKRYKEGAINFETVEVKFKLDEAGKPIGVYIKERKDSNMLIEDFMLLANRLVAEFVGKKKLAGAPYPFVYRVHDTPDPEKLEDLKNMAKVFGYKLNFDKPDQIAHSFNKMMEEIKGKPEQNMLESLAIRTMAKAIYTTENIGHYGLAFPYYTHFTSPIRRYPDVLVHRILSDVLYEENKKAYPNLQQLCKHSSDMEKAASDAERMSVKYKQVEYMTDKVGTVFEGIISGATEWGIFVEIIENKCEGLIRLNALDGDFYEYDEKTHAVKGRKYGKRYRLGDKIMVRVMKADMAKRQLDFELVD